MQHLQKGWKVFKQSFTVDSSQEPFFMATRYRYGSIVATMMAFYNLFLIRQRIIKNSIALTKSNNSKIVKFSCFLVGSVYFSGLYILWQVPSFFAETAARTYVAMQDAITTITLKDTIQNVLLNDQRLKKVLIADGLKC